MQFGMVENLKYGTFANSVSTGSSHTDVSNNGIVEKYCYNNDPNNCDIYGAMYDWNEAMMYTSIEGAQGVCPSGWHIPTDTEWYTLENYLDSNVNDPNFVGWRGNDISTKLQSNNGMNLVFSGDRGYHGGFANQGNDGYYWSSTPNNNDITINEKINGKIEIE